MQGRMQDEFDPDRLIDDFLSDDAHGVLKAITLLRRLEREDPRLVGPVAWRALLHIDGRLVVGECVELLRILYHARGRRDTERHIMHEWQAMGEKGRSNICYAAHFSDVMPTRLLLQLFDHPASTVRNRHLLAMGLVRTAEERKANDLVPLLLNRIGEYPDEQRQDELNAFRTQAWADHYKRARNDDVIEKEGDEE